MARDGGPHGVPRSARARTRAARILWSSSISATDATPHHCPTPSSEALEVDLTLSSRPQVGGGPHNVAVRRVLAVSGRSEPLLACFWGLFGVQLVIVALLPARVSPLSHPEVLDAPSRPPGRAGRVGERGGAARSRPPIQRPPGRPPNRRRSGPALGRGGVDSGPGVPGECAPSPGGGGRDPARPGRRSRRHAAGHDGRRSAGARPPPTSTTRDDGHDPKSRSKSKPKDSGRASTTSSSTTTTGRKTTASTTPRAEQATTVRPRARPGRSASQGGIVPSASSDGDRCRITPGPARNPAGS